MELQKTKQIYPAYKATNIDWIGDIPVDWEIRKLKQFFVFEKGKNAGSFTQEYVNDEVNTGEYPVYSGQTENNGVMGMINSYIYDFEKVLFTTTVGAKVMTPMCLSGKFSLSQNCVLMVKSDKSVEEKYIYYQLFPLFKRKLDDIPSHMQPSLRISDLNKFSIIFPPFTEQQSIADYLDTKTSQIDQIISLKQQQIELLKEKRTALINHVVTKGLDPNVEMVESGIEWIGMIPKGWKITKMSRLVDVRDGTHDTPGYVDEIEGIPFVTSKDLENGKINFSEVKYISKEDHEQIKKRSFVEKGDILMAMIGTVGNPAIVETDMEFSIKNVALFKAKKVTYKFLYYYLISDACKCFIDIVLSGGIQKFIGLGDIRFLKIVLPSKKEQQDISDYLDSKTSQIDETITAVEKSIELLTEYKQSLISHVVTGKVKVF